MIKAWIRPLAATHDQRRSAQSRRRHGRCGLDGICGGLAHILLTESYRLAPASLIAPFDYTSMLWALVLGFLVFGEVPSVLVFVGAGIIASAGLFVIWRERQLALQRGKGKVSSE